MSAIAGIYYLDGRTVELAPLTQMIDTLAHRGSDGTGIWREGPIGLGHRMLWTTPESLHEQLPLVNQTSTCAITADARIDNRDELIAALGLTDRPLEKITDSQLVLAAYEQWGDRAPDMLLGDFAFAIWDGRRQRLFCARDPMGVKPFYYYCSNRVFVFASEIKALFCLPEVPRRLNEVKVAYHLTTLFEDQAVTFYQDILRLPAAHSITVGREKTQVRRYWSLDPAREVRLHSDADYAEAFREIFTEAVRCRLRSAFPIGSALSGGLDSSSITCTARRLLASGQRLHTFSAIFPSLPKEDRRWLDERRYIKAIEAVGVESHHVHADCLSPLVKLLWHEDEAVPAPNLYMHQALYSAAHQQGVRVFLDGLDGDSTVSHGWGFLRELTFTGRWKTLLTETTALARRYQSSRRRLLCKYGFKPLVVEPILQWSMLRGCTQPTWRVNSVISPTFAQRVGLTERIQALLSHRSSPTRTAKQEHLLGLTSGLHAYALELIDKGAAAFSLSARYPFYDRRLIEFCLALPPEQKLHQGWTRIVMRRAMTDILPPEVQWRVHKANLGTNFKRKLLEYERDTLERVINEPQIIEPYVDVPTLRAAYQRYASQPLQSQQDVTTVFATVTLALWLLNSGIRP